MADAARPLRQTLAAATVAVALGLTGCSGVSATGRPFGRPVPEATAACEAVEASSAAQARLFRRAETERAEQLTREIERLQADLRTAEAALVEAESGLAGSHTRADAVSSLAVTRIQVERAAARAPWRAGEIAGAREKLDQAEAQVREGRFGAALFFVYRARRVAESVLAEADQVIASANARLIRAQRVNLRAGPSTEDPILSVLEGGTPVIPQADEGSWMLVQVTGGPAGWIHRNLLGERISDGGSAPASVAP